MQSKASAAGAGDVGTGTESAIYLLFLDLVEVLCLYVTKALGDKTEWCCIALSSALTRQIGAAV